MAGGGRPTNTAQTDLGLGEGDAAVHGTLAGLPHEQGGRILQTTAVLVAHPHFSPSCPQPRGHGDAALGTTEPPAAGSLTCTPQRMQQNLSPGLAKQTGTRLPVVMFERDVICIGQINGTTQLAICPGRDLGFAFKHHFQPLCSHIPVNTTGFSTQKPMGNKFIESFL